MRGRKIQTIVAVLCHIGLTPNRAKITFNEKSNVKVVRSSILLTAQSFWIAEQRCPVITVVWSSGMIPF